MASGAIGVKSSGACNPFWANNGNAFGAESGAGGSPQEPTNFAAVATGNAWGAGGYWTLDMAEAKQFIVAQNYGGTGGGGTSKIADVPDATKRWGYRWYWGEKFTALPAAGTRRIWVEGAAGNVWRLYLNDDGTVDLEIPGGTAVASGTKVYAINTQYVFDLWVVHKDSSGVNLATPKWFLRALEGFSDGASPTVTVDINAVAVAHPSGASTGSELWIGDDVNTLTCTRQISNVFGGWDDADNHFGVIRLAHAELTGNGARASWTQATDSGVHDKWREVGDETVHDPPPDDDTSYISIASGTSVEQTFDCLGLSFTDELLIGVNVLVRGRRSGSGKGASFTCAAMINKAGSGADELWADPKLGFVDTVHTFRSWFFNLPPDGGTTWAADDVGSSNGTLEVGVVGTVNAASGFCTAITALVSYQKAGETLPALPGSTVRPALLNRTPAPALLAAPIYRHTPRSFAGLFAAAAPPAGPDRRRWAAHV